MAEMDKKEISALISLLDDPDEKIFGSIKGKLLDIGEIVIPVLEDAWESSFSPLLQSRIENIIHRIQFEKILESLTEWKQNNSDNLWMGVLLIARYQYPDLKEEKLEKQIQLIKQDVWLELNENLTALEKVRVINHILFDVHRFSGNTENYNAPENSYINKVLENKKGNPLTLAIIYLVIANQLQMPIYGVNLPQHFVMAYVDENDLSDNEWEDKILFYINPFSKGAVFSRREIDMFLKQLNLSPEKMYYTPCSNSNIIERLIRNLVSAYNKLGHPDKVAELEEMLSLLEK
ncbi:MAG TPA: transglutaminase-like domain-containing protein [Bacteroidia bacterium]|nr:transglutaminase-like domain-containing protein [Bacteroidia bacterium]